MPNSLRLRKREKTYSPDPAVWLGSHQVTKTEVTLRLASFLLTSKLAASDVVVALSANELNRRRDQPQFPVVRFLKRYFAAPSSSEKDWQGIYRLKTAPDDHPHPHLRIVPDHDGV